MKAISEYIDNLADRLTEAGYLTDAEWRKALHSVPRHLFAPAVAWFGQADDPSRRADRPDDEAAWLDAVYSDTAIITQLDDGATPLENGGDNYTSSLSAPGILMAFLELLDPFEGDAVLEIGTGTGWTAGLLSSRVGAENITSVEVDPEVAKQAALNLEAAGYTPNLIVGDGATLRPDGGPFDRVHVTCGVTTLPYGWVERTRPGGAIVFPWMPGIEGGHKVKLTVTNEGIALGRFAYGGAAYMMLRSQRSTGPHALAEDYRESATLLDPRRVFRASYGADVALAGMLPDVSATTDEGVDGSFTASVWQGSAAAQVRYTPGRERFTVWESGPRDLWDEVEAAYFRWLSWGSPDRDHFGMTVTPESQYLWLDDPRRVIGERPGSSVMSRTLST